MRLTTADLVVLSVVLNAGPMHGHGLFNLLEKSDVQDWAPISRPQVYYSLRKLADHAYLIPVSDKDPVLGPERVVYRTAAKARRAIQGALKDTKWTTRRPPSPFVTWVALALNAKPNDIVEQIERRAEFLSAEIMREKVTLKGLSHIETRDVRVARVLVKMAIKQFEAEAKLLDELRDALEEDT